MPSSPVIEINERNDSPFKKLSNQKSCQEESENANFKEILETCVTEQYTKLLKAFSALDTKKNSTISIRDFRNTIEKHFIQLEDKDFEYILSQVLKHPNGYICYHSFLNQFCNTTRSKSTEPFTFSPKPREMTLSVSPTRERKNSLEETKLLLSEKFCKNVSAALKAFQFYDYNRNGKISKFNFRKVLEKYDFKLTNQQIERLWQSENCNSSRMLDYNHFLQKLVTSGNKSNSCSGNMAFPSASDVWDPKTGVILQPSETWPPYKKFFQLTPEEEEQILRRLEIQVRDVVYRYHYKIRKSFENADPTLQGFVSVDVLRQILETYMEPMADEVFGNLMRSLGLQPSGLIAWQVFLNNFRCAKEPNTVKTVEFMDIPKEIVPLKNTNCDVTANTVIFHLGQCLLHQFGTMENAFRKLDHRDRGWLTRIDIITEIRKLYYCLNEKEYQDICVIFDPDHRNKIYLPKFLEILKGETTTFTPPESYVNLQPAPPPSPTRKISYDKVEQILKDNLVTKCDELKSKINLASIRDHGILSSKAFKSILDTVIFPIDEQHFCSLMKRYGTPRKDGLIDCQQFFEKFVGNQNLFVVPTSIFDSMKGNCCPRPCGEKKVCTRECSGSSTLVTAERFPYILAERSQKSGQSLTKNQLTYRKSGKDILTLNTLENLIKSFGIFINGSELNKIWKKCDPEGKGYALYEDFLDGCGIEDFYKRNNEVGSLGYILMWKVAGQKIPHPSANPAPNTTTKEKKKFDGIPPDFLLREMFIKSPHNIWKSIGIWDVNKNGQIPTEEVRRVINGYGLRLNDAQWNYIMDDIKAKDTLDLKEFYKYVMHGQEMPDFSGNSTQKSYTLKEIETLVNQNVCERKNEFLTAFREADYKNLHVVGRQDFEDVLRKFRIRMEPEMLHKFWLTLPLNEDKKLVYRDFLALFSNPSFNSESGTTSGMTVCCQPQPPTAAHHYPMQPTPPETGTPKYFSSYQAETKNRYEEERKAYDEEQEIADKVAENLKDIIVKLNHASIHNDTFLPPEMIKAIIESVTHPIPEDTFNRMLNRHVTARIDGLINYQQFLMRLVPGCSDGGRVLAGENRRIIPSICAEKNIPYVNVSANQLPPLLAKLTQNHLHSVTKGYLTFTKAGKDLLTMNTLKNFLAAFKISMNEGEFNRLWRQCDPEDKRYITYEEFLERCGLEEVYKGSSETGSSKYVIIWKLMDKETFKNLKQQSMGRLSCAANMLAREHSTLDSENYLRETIMSLPVEIWKAISDLDVQKTDLIPVYNLKNLLTMNGVKMNDNEWKQILIPFTNEHGQLNIKLFMSHLLYGRTQATGLNENPLTAKCLRELEKHISTYSKDLLAAFKEADYAFLNTVSQETFQNILRKIGLDMDQPTFLKFWSLLPVNDYGNLMYQDFLNWINARARSPISFHKPSTTVSRSYAPWKPPGPHCPNTGRPPAEVLPLEVHTARRIKKAEIVNANRKKEKPFYYGSARLVNAEKAECLVRDIILKNWKLIQKKCRQHDPDFVGYINPEKFKEILLYFMGSIQEEKFQKLKDKFDIKGDGTLAYKDLIRYFLFDQKPTKLVPGQHRLLRKLETDTFETGPTDGLLAEALKRLRQCVINNWRLMRRSFQIADPSKTDHVDIITFRQILKAHNVNLTEEEFFQIMSFYDKDFSACINYNSFLRAFLQNW